MTISKTSTQVSAAFALLLVLIGLLANLANSAALAGGSALPTDFSDTNLASGLSNPTSMALAPDGRIFVAEQGGKLRVIKNGTLLTTPFVSLTVDSDNERGLLGVAFDPDFTTNNRVYVYYTVPAANGNPAFNRVSRFTANGDVAIGGSELILVNLDNLSGATNHNGGAIHFGPDGKLYVAVGENATASNAQSLNNRLGKMLRYNPDGTIPSDNPSSFAGVAGTTSGANRAIWALGLRNPFTFAFQPGTGVMHINDVGQNSYEEVNVGQAGVNYGWPQTEGNQPPGTANVTYPLYTYSHGSGEFEGYVIAGGTFYNPASANFPADYVNDYFFADSGSNRIWVRDSAGGTVTTFASSLVVSAPVDLAVTPSGTLLYLARGDGSTTGAVRRIQFTGPPPVLIPRMWLPLLKK